MTHEEIKREFRELKKQLRIVTEMLNSMMCDNDKTPLLSMKQTAVRLNCSYRQLKKITATGEICYTLVGKRKMFSQKNITDYLQGK